MSLVIPDEFLQTAQMTEADLKLEIAILLFQQEKITLETASQFADLNQLELQRILSSRKIPVHPSVEDFRQDPKTLETNDLAHEETDLAQTEILKRIEQRRTFAPVQHYLPDTLTLLQDDRSR